MSKPRDRAHGRSAMDGGLVITDSTLDIDVVYESDTALVRLAGELDYLSAPMLGEKLDSLSGQALGKIALDCQELEFIDSEGIKVILRVHARLAEIGGSLSIVGCSKHVARVFQMIGVDKTIPVSGCEFPGFDITVPVTL